MHPLELAGGGGASHAEKHASPRLAPSRGKNKSTGGARGKSTKHTALTDHDLSMRTILQEAEEAVIREELFHDLNISNSTRCCVLMGISSPPKK